MAFAIFLTKFSYYATKIIIKSNRKKEEKKINKENSIELGNGTNGKVYIEKKDLYQNMLITGSIGTGKTSGAICNICDALIKQNVGGLILDIKGNFINTIEEICKKYNRQKDVKVISVGSENSFELLPNNLSNVEAASMLKQIISLLSPNNNSDSYWLDKVQDILLNLFILIDYYNNKNKDMLEIHRLVTDANYIAIKIEECKRSLLKGKDSDKVMFELQNVFLFLQNEFLNLDSRVQSILKSEITRLTIPIITEYEIYNQFGKHSNKLQYIDFSNRHQIVVLSMDIAENKSMVKIISTFLKLNFQREILKNIINPIPTFFIADEYQEFVNVEDATFLSLSREAKCMNIISTQSYSSIKNTLKDENATSVIIQNLVNKIWFRNDDNFTIQEVIKQLGKVNVKKETTQISENATESKKHLLIKGFKNKKSNISTSISKVMTKENEYDENFFTRELKVFEALCFLSNYDKGIIVQKVQIQRWNKNKIEVKERSK